MNETTTAQGPCVDHLVVFAADLAGGVDWCQRTLGITPTAGGEHPLMGTHNRLLNIASEAFPQAYLEIIAIDPAVTPTRAAGLHRWFDLDDATLQAAAAENNLAGALAEYQNALKIRPGHEGLTKKVKSLQKKIAAEKK